MWRRKRQEREDGGGKSKHGRLRREPQIRVARRINMKHVIMEALMGVRDNFIGLLQRTGDSFIRDNIYMVDKTMLAKALKNIDPQHQEKVLINMTDDAAADVRKIMGGLDNVSDGEIEEAQQQIMALAAQAI